MKRALAALFRLEGGRPLSEKEFVQFASYRLSWFKPTEAQRLLRVAQDLRLLELRGGILHPTFEIAAVEVPVDFRPPPSVLERPPAVPDLFLTIINRIVEKGGADRRAAVAAVNAIQERMDIDVEVAALIHARGLGLDISEMIDLVRERIEKRLS